MLKVPFPVTFRTNLSGFSVFHMLSAKLEISTPSMSPPTVAFDSHVTPSVKEELGAHELNINSTN